MKICLIIDDYLPASIKVGAKMMHELAKEFVALGHDVIVITPTLKLVDSENKNPGYEIDVIDEVKVFRFLSGEIKNVSKIKRAINETLLSYRAWKSGKQFFKNNPYDLIVYYSPSIFWGVLVHRLKKLWGCPSYLIVRDFFPQWVIDNGMLSAKSPITYYFRIFEWLSYRAADTIGIQSPKNLAWFSKICPIKRPLDLLYNWAANEPVPSGDSHYRKELGLENKVVYFYGGNIGHAQDMMNIVRLANSMRSEADAHFVLVGAGDEFDLVQDSITKLNLANMTLLPPVTQEEFKLMLAEFDVGLFSLHHDHSTHNFPGKLLGYMVQEKPILGSINPDNDLKDIVEEYKAGLITVNGDDAGLFRNALTLLHDINLRKTMGINAKQLLADVFSVQAAAHQILSTTSVD
jgi:glycosyltransferase involved in cell wall biosynthesis